MPDKIPTARDVVNHLNGRFEDLGLTFRLSGIAVLPYVNPMWLANWEVPGAESEDDSELILNEIQSARWKFPQVLEDFSTD